MERRREAEAYFTRTGRTTFRAGEHAAGAWNTAEQHIAPLLALMTRAIEADRDRRRDDGLIITRLSFDILGKIPLGEVEIQVRLVRPGRTIELVEAQLTYHGRDAVLLRAWLMDTRDTSPWAGSELPAITPREEMPTWNMSEFFAGGFIASVEAHRESDRAGRSCSWARSTLPLIDGEETTPLCRAISVFDLANGMAIRAHPDDVTFPNIDVTAHLFGDFSSDWVGFDTAVSYGPHGIGLTNAILHDARGPVGTLAQIVTVRPR